MPICVCPTRDGGMGLSARHARTHTHMHNLLKITQWLQRMEKKGERATPSYYASETIVVPRSLCQRLERSETVSSSFSTSHNE